MKLNPELPNPNGHNPIGSRRSGTDFFRSRKIGSGKKVKTFSRGNTGDRAECLGAVGDDRARVSAKELGGSIFHRGRGHALRIDTHPADTTPRACRESVSSHRWW